MPTVINALYLNDYASYSTPYSQRTLTTSGGRREINDTNDGGHMITQPPAQNTQTKINLNEAEVNTA